MICLESLKLHPTHPHHLETLDPRKQVFDSFSMSLSRPRTNEATAVFMTIMGILWQWRGMSLNKDANSESVGMNPILALSPQAFVKAQHLSTLGYVSVLEQKNLSKQCAALSGFNFIYSETTGWSMLVIKRRIYGKPFEKQWVLNGCFESVLYERLRNMHRPISKLE